MIKLIRLLLGLCDHKYEIIERRDICRKISNQNKVTGTFFIQKCNKCGNIKQTTVKV